MGLFNGNKDIISHLYGSFNDFIYNLRSLFITPTVQFVLLEKDANKPTKTYDTDSGYDLYSYEDVIIEPGHPKNVYAGIAICPPKGWGYTIRGRSSLNKKNIYTALGTIDSFYSGPLYALLYNFSKQSYVIEKGDRIAQIVFERVRPIRMKMVEKIITPPGSRSSAGFGSSGK